MFIFITDGELAFQKGLAIADNLRDHNYAVQVLVNCGGGSLKNQFKKADKSGARLALILGEQELEHYSITIKSLREKAEQVTIGLKDLLGHLSTIL